MKKWMRGAVAAVIVLILIAGGIVAVKVVNHKKQQNDKDIIVKDNVKVITADMPEDEQPKKVVSEGLIFDKDPEYKKGDIIVSGVTKEAENGFIRRVTDVRKVKDEYQYWTEPAGLTDVFEKLHIVKQYELTEDGAEEVAYNIENKDVMDGAAQIQTAIDDVNQPESVVKLADEESGEEYMFGPSISLEKDPVSLNGNAGFSVWLEVDIDIERGEIEFGMALKHKAGVNLALNCGKDFNRNIDQTVFSKDLPKLEISLAGVPVVITNTIELVAGADTKGEGKKKLSYESSVDRTLGFEYSSKSGKVKEINKRNDKTDGLNWSTGISVSGKVLAGAGLHLVSKLYDAAGVDLAAEIAGSADGEAKVTTKEDLEGYAGSLKLAVVPGISGKVVADLPIIDENLAETTLFKKELKPIWSKEWKSSSDWKADMEWDGVGEQAGTYQTKYHDTYTVTCPVFQFDIPSGWEVQSEEVNSVENPVAEKVVLANSRGVTITYWDCTRSLGGYSRSALKAEVTNAGKADFKPGYPAGTDRDMSSPGEFMAAKVHIVGSMMAGIDEDYQPVDTVFYALVPASYEGMMEFEGQAGYVDSFSFEYPTPVALIAESPDGTFSASEERDVIRILKSFKTVGEVQ